MSAGGWQAVSALASSAQVIALAVVAAWAGRRLPPARPKPRRATPAELEAEAADLKAQQLRNTG
jgi:hypothetical protein